MRSSRERRGGARRAWAAAATYLVLASACRPGSAGHPDLVAGGDGAVEDAASHSRLEVKRAARGVGDAGEARDSSPTGAARPRVTPWTEAVRMERWSDAAEGFDALPDGERSRPEMRFARARIALALGDARAATEGLTGLVFPLLEVEMDAARADAAMTVGAYAEAGAYFLARSERPGGRPSDRAQACHALVLAGDGRAEAACDRAIAKGGTEAAVRADRMAIASRPVVARAADARWIAVHAPAHARAREADGLLASLDPGHPLGPSEELERARGFETAGDTRRALEVLDRLGGAASRPTDLELAKARAEILFSDRDRGVEASAAYDALAERVPRGSDQEADARFFAARTLSRADHDDEAMVRYAAVMSRFPRSKRAGEASYLRGRLLGLHGRYAEAEAALDETAARYPRASELRDVHRLRAVYRLAAKRPGAEAIFLGLARRDPNAEWGTYDARMRNLAARALLAKGEREAATAAWRLLVATDPFSWGGQMARAHLAALDPSLRASTWSPAPARDGSSTPPTSVDATSLPPRVALLHSLGFDADAEAALRETEAVVGRDLPRLCAAYQAIERGKRLFQLSPSLPGRDLARPPDAASAWAWNCAYPTPYRAVARAAESRESLPPGLLYAIMRQESGFDPEARSPARAFGLLQLLPETGAEVAKALGRPFDPSELTSIPVNVDLGAHYVRMLLDRFGAGTALSIPLAIGAYNGGPDAIARWRERAPGLELDLFLEQIPYAETRGYVARVVEHLARYAVLEHGEAAMPRWPL